MYSYDQMKPKLLTEEGVDLLLNVRSHIRQMFKSAGAFRVSTLIHKAPCGDPWMVLACIEYLVNQGEIQEIKSTYPTAQDRVYVENPNALQ